MNELVKAVLALALSTAAAVWLLGVALHLWPSADQLAYGNPLPYLKVRMDSGAVKFWVEDFGGLPYERVWLYVNGMLAASGGPGTDAVARCGDEVAAVVKYHSGTKKLEGRILCTKPIKASGGGLMKREIRLIQTAQAYRAMTGDMHQTGPPLRFDGLCDIDFPYPYGRASVTITALRPDVIFCVGVHCGTSYTFSWTLPPPGPYTFPRTVREIASIHVFKTPDAPASQLLGGGRGVIDIYVEYSYNRNVNAYDLEVYVNGTRVAYCRRQTDVSRELASWTEYKEPNATAVYLIRFVGERNGRPVVLDGNIVLYERKDGSFGYRLIVNPVEDPTPEDLNTASPHMNLVLRSPSDATYRGAVSLPFILEEMPQMRLHNDIVDVYTGPFFRFLQQLSNDPQQKSMFMQALDKMVDIEFNVPYIAVNRTGEHLVYHIHAGRQGRSVTLSFKALSISSLGAVYANAVLPIDIKLPPPVLPQNGTRTYIFSYS
jgi:hypothetical protein